MCMQMKHEQNNCDYSTLFHRFHLAEEINYIYIVYVVSYRQIMQCTSNTITSQVVSSLEGITQQNISIPNVRVKWQVYDM